MFNSKDFLVNTAPLKCNQSTAPVVVPLTVTSTTSVNYTSKKAATVEDKAPAVNIGPFGSCKLLNNNTCTPQPQEWLKFKEDVFHESKNAITKNSCIMCSIGGIITPDDSGQ